jgi:hypothetical protein
MNDDKHNTPLKIQYMLKIKDCNNLLDELKTIGLKSNAESKAFDEFKKIIIKKEIIQIVKNFTESLDKLKKGLEINPRVFITAYMIAYFPDELLGEEKDRHPTDNFIHELSTHVVNSLEEGNINKIWDLLRDFKIGYNNWSKMDKDRTIERLVISYYFRCKHIDKIKSDNLDKKVDIIEPDQQFYMIKELEKQKEDIIKSIKLIDKNFDVNFLKENYVQIYDTIQQTWLNLQVNLANTLKKAFYDMLVQDINDGNLMSCFKLLKEIGERLVAICPSKNANSFKSKFSDNNLTDLLLEPEFTPELIKFIGMIIDFISLMDAPINDETNKQWKEHNVELLSGNFSTNFPQILIQIEEHIDAIYELILAMNESK